MLLPAARAGIMLLTWGDDLCSDQVSHASIYVLEPRLLQVHRLFHHFVLKLLLKPQESFLVTGESVLGENAFKSRYLVGRDQLTQSLCLVRVYLPP
jgi:hypothetical protein